MSFGLLDIVKDYLFGTRFIDACKYQTRMVDDAVEAYPDLNPKQTAFLERQREVYAGKIKQRLEKKKSALEELTEEELQNRDEVELDKIKAFENDPDRAMDKAVMIASQGTTISYTRVFVVVWGILPTIVSALGFGAYLMTKDMDYLSLVGFSEAWRTSSYIGKNNIITPEFREESQ